MQHTYPAWPSIFLSSNKLHIKQMGALSHITSTLVHQMFTKLLYYHDGSEVFSMDQSNRSTYQEFVVQKVKVFKI